MMMTMMLIATLTMTVVVMMIKMSVITMMMIMMMITMATLPGAWRFRVNAETGWPGVSIL